MFLGLKKGNVANQREHLVMLLANMDVRDKNLEEYAQVNYCSECYKHLDINLYPVGGLIYPLCLLDGYLNPHFFLQKL